MWEIGVGEMRDELSSIVEIDPEKMSGTPVLKGTSVITQHLFDYLEGGDSMRFFLTIFRQ